MKRPAILFKKCSCGIQWRTREQFLSDPHIELTGYMADFEKLRLGLVLFLHRKKNCCTTLSIYANQVKDLYHGPIFRKKLTGSKQCPGICLREEILADVDEVGRLPRRQRARPGEPALLRRHVWPSAALCQPGAQGGHTDDIHSRRGKSFVFVFSVPNHFSRSRGPGARYDRGPCLASVRVINAEARLAHLPCGNAESDAD